MDKILTIVIPTYNMEKYLRKCLDSLIIDEKNLFDKLEVLVVNDGSKDSSSAIAHEFQNRYPNVFRVIDKENGNYGSCVNRGLKEAAGKYIKVLDADDKFDTKNFPLFLSYLMDDDVDCVISDMDEIDESGNKVFHQCYDLPLNKVFTLRDAKGIWKSVWMHCVCYKTDNLRRISYYQTEGISYTDQEWICLPMAVSTNLKYFPKVLYKYSVGREGQTICTEVWEKNFRQEIEGTKVLLESHRVNSQRMSANADYIDTRILVRLNTIYIAYFFKFESYINHDILVEFDTYLEEKWPLFFDKTNYVEVSRFYHSNIVKAWRKEYNDNAISVTILKVICNILITCNRIINLIHR